MCRGGQEWLRSAPVRRLRHPLEESPVWGVLGSMFAGLVALLAGLPVLVVACVLVPSCLLARHLLLLLFWNRHSDERMGSGSDAGAPESMRGNDGRWLGSAWRCSVIHAVLVFEAGSGLDVAQLRHLLLTRVVPLYPRLTRRPVPLPLSAGAGHCWLPDCGFDIQRHVFPGPRLLATEKQLQDYVARLLSEGLPVDKPPWEVHVVHSYGRHEDTVAVLRVHQSVADGMALVRVLCHSLADYHVLHVPQKPHFGAMAFTVNLVRACLVGPLTLLLWLLLTAGDCNLLTQQGAWTGKATVTWSAAITLPKVTRIKQVTRSTVNCVLLSALAGAARRLLQGCGIKQPRDMKVVLPVDLRSDVSSTRSSQRLGSKVAPVVLGLPVSIEGAVPRLWATRRLLNSLRSSADHVVVYVATAALMSVVPGQLTRRLLAALTGKATLQFSSLPGPPSALMVGGHLLKGVYPLLPAQGTLGIAVSVFTYADQVYVAVISDSALGPAASTLLEHLHAQVELLWKLLLHRRVPGESRPHLAGLRSDVTGSPVRELRLRLSTVQKEVHKLSQGSRVEAEAARIRHLKTEFSQLLTELQRRHSHIGNSSAYFEDEEVDGDLRPRRRAMSCTTSRCSHLSLMGLISSGRPASYAEPTQEAPASTDRHRLSQDQHKTHKAQEGRCINIPSPHANTPTRSRHHEPPSTRKTMCISRVCSRQTLNISKPLPEESFDDTLDAATPASINEIYYINECSDKNGSSQNIKSIVDCEATWGKAHFQQNHDITERSFDNACVTSQLVTKVECYVKETKVTDTGDTDTPERSSCLAEHSPCDSPILQCSECHPLLSNDHTSQILPYHSECGIATTVKPSHHRASEPSTDNSHVSCVTGCRKTSNSPHVSACAPHIACGTYCVLNVTDVCKRTDSNDSNRQTTHRQEPSTNSVQCVCAEVVSSTSDIHMSNKTTCKHSPLPHNSNHSLAKHCHLVRPETTKCSNRQET